MLQNALFLAVFLYDIPIVRFLLEKGAVATGEGMVHVEMQRRNLSPQGIKTNVTGKNFTKTRFQPIHAAFADLSLEMIKLLVVEYRCGVLDDCLGMPIWKTRQVSAQEMFATKLRPLTTFIPSAAYSPALWASCQYSHTSALKICLEFGADPNHIIHTRGSQHLVLCFAMQKDHRVLEMVDILIRAGAEPYQVVSGTSGPPRTFWNKWSKYHEINMKWNDVVRKLIADSDFSLEEHLYMGMKEGYL
ncbi:hypothetical protein B0T22DRAFT_163144 [Podospora appendiculata]|uniref:Ankyrin n=1 Tax=Podospora appendiculata TaxID=314037 RepID=A0AAE0XAI9_9PEZI|nr:hypothetical protein B0T22DRAFT_163144 [Podospora appendiculata]